MAFEIIYIKIIFKKQVFHSDRKVEKNFNRKKNYFFGCLKTQRTFTLSIEAKYFKTKNFGRIWLTGMLTYGLCYKLSVMCSTFLVLKYSNLMKSMLVISESVKKIFFKFIIFYWVSEVLTQLMTIPVFFFLRHFSICAIVLEIVAVLQVIQETFGGCYKIGLLSQVQVRKAGLMSELR